MIFSKCLLIYYFIFLIKPGLYSTSLNSANRENFTVATLSLKNPVGVAVDWVANKVYVVDLAAKRIDVMELSGQYRAIVISQNLTAPLAIAIDPLQGAMFISDRYINQHYRKENIIETDIFMIIL